MIKKVILFLLICFVFLNSTLAQDNPFVTGTQKKETPIEQEFHYPGIIQTMFNAIGNFQKTLNSSLSAFSHELTEKNNRAVIFALIGISILYGIVHAIGPGHGKIIIISYVLSSPIKAKQGIVMGVFIAVIHTLSAVILVSVLYFILNTVFAASSQKSIYMMSLISNGCIAGMGIFLIARIVWIKVKKPEHENIKGETSGISNRSLVIPALVAGLVPCEGAILILVFFISINAFALGIMIAAFMSLGMAITISIMGILTVYSKKGVVLLADKKPGLVKHFLFGMQILGSIIIFLFGLSLLLSKVL